MEVYNALGRRKRAVTRVYLNDGKGSITVNNRELTDYFPSTHSQYMIMQPLKVLECADQYDIKANVSGGGSKGQAESLRLAITRALIKINPEHKKLLKSHGLVTRDPREKERKKPGQPKARKKFQFSKR